MSFTKISVAIGALAYAAQVAAHGHVQGITVDGQYFTGPIPSIKYNPVPIAGWLADNGDNGFVEPASFSNPDIICHKSAKPGALSIKVAAGSDVELHWNTWPESHHGPVIDYLANCNGDCSTVEKTSLKFNKIKEGGLIDKSVGQTGSWASDELIANNNSWTTTIPSSIAPGNYVLRHEIIALHSAGDANGAQNYPQCINLEITGSGSNKLASGTVGTSLYKADDAGIKVSIYPVQGEYKIPGPALMSGGSSGDEEPSTGDETTSSSSVAAPEPTGSSTATSSAATAVPTTLVTKTSPSATAPTTPEVTTPAGAGDEEEDDSTCE